MWLLTLVQSSVLVQPLYLGEEPPELRSLRGIRLCHAGAVECPAEITRSRDDALALATDLARRLRGGVSFESVAAEYAPTEEWKRACMIGSFTPGMLSAPFDRFLSAAADGEISDPIATESGVHLLQRVEARAAVLQILVRGVDARARCEELLRRLRQGEEFADVARACSEDADSAARGGQFAIYERGARDTLLKKAAFELAIGAIGGPYESPLGWHLLKRVPLGAVDPALSESNFVRLRAILIQFDTARGADPATAPDQQAAKSIADGIHRRLLAGEDMRKLAREFDQDRGGREREGDLGWLHRHAPNVPPPLERAFLMRPGDTSEPFPTSMGYLIVRRER